MRKTLKKITYVLKRACLGGGIILIPCSLILFFYVYSLTIKITKKFSSLTWDIPSKVYSDSLQIYPGLNIHSIHLKERLDRLGYQEVSDEVTGQGEYRIEISPKPDQATWTLYLHDFEYPLTSSQGGIVRLEILENTIVQMQRQKSPAHSSEELSIIELEPELITEFFENTREDRQIVRIEQVPSDLLNAIVSVEDQRFLTHVGIDPKGILRAFYLNLRAGAIVQGGSTITQQLVKNFFLTQKRSYIRKIQEALMALIVERRHSKDEILEAYINEVYFGQRGGAGIFGVAEAARFYFAKPLHKLTLSECAMLAGIIRGPAIYSPFQNKEKAIQRRNFVLKKMLETKTVLRREYEKAIEEPLRPRKIPFTTNSSPYFVDFVRNELLQKYSTDVLNTQGLRIFTTLDVFLQRLAETAVKETLQQLESQFRPLAPQENDSSLLQGAFVAIHPQTGYILAMVGGRNYGESQFNRITQAYRQPGSLFKPLVLLTALTLKGGNKFKLTDKFSDHPFEWKYEGQTWNPQNYEEEFRGDISLRTVLEQSVNIPIARLAREVGIKRIIKLAKKLGIERSLPPIPSLSLGSVEVTPLEVATFYSVLANNGTKATPISIKHVIDPKGKILEKRAIDIEEVVSQEAAFLVTYALQGAINQGTARGVRLSGYTRPVAGKTGTTSDYMDAWFAGYTPDLVGISWVGFDKKKPIGLTGAQAALPMWTRFMMRASESRPLSNFLMPENIVLRKIDPETGLLATKLCPLSFDEAFIKGSEPTTPCPIHSPSKQQKKDK